MFGVDGDEILTGVLTTVVSAIVIGVGGFVARKVFLRRSAGDRSGQSWTGDESTEAVRLPSRPPPEHRIWQIDSEERLMNQWSNHAPEAEAPAKPATSLPPTVDEPPAHGKWWLTSGSDTATTSAAG